MTDIDYIATINEACEFLDIDWPTLASITVPLGIIAKFKGQSGLKDMVYEQAKRLLLDKKD